MLSRKTLFGRLFRFITRTHDSSTAFGPARSGRLLAVFILSAGLLFGLLDVIRANAQTNYSPPWFGYVFLVVSFLVNRYYSYSLSAFMTSLMFPFVLSLYMIQQMPNPPLTSLNFLILGIILAAHFLSLPRFFTVFGCSLGVVIFVPLGLGLFDQHFAIIIQPLILVGLGGLLTTTFRLHVDAVEKNRRMQLEESEQRYRTVFDAVPDGISIHLVESGVIEKANRSILNKVRLPDHSKSSHTPPSGLAIPPFSSPDFKKHCAQTHIDGFHAFEWHGTDGFGTNRWLEVRMSRVSIGGNERILAISRDITNRKKIEEKSAQMHRWMESILRTVPIPLFAADTDG